MNDEILAKAKAASSTTGASRRYRLSKSITHTAKRLSDFREVLFMTLAADNA